MSMHLSGAMAPRLLFAGALVGLGWIAVDSPSWARALQLQGYYTDFSLRLDAEPQGIAAGRLGSLRASVASLGPDASLHTTLTLREDEDVTLLDEGACLPPASQSLRCPLGALQPDETPPPLFLWIVSNPDARGLRLFSGYLDSENPPTQNGPGLNVDATWVNLVGEFDSGMRLLTPTPEALADGYLRWTYEVDNRGPSSLIEAFHSLNSFHGFRTVCRGYAGAICATPQGAIFMPPGSRFEVDVEVPRTLLEVSDIGFSAGFLSTEGTQIGSRPRSLSVYYSRWIHQDGFGD